MSVLLAVAACAAVALGMSAPPPSSPATKALAIFRDNAPISRVGAHRQPPPLRLAQSKIDTPVATVGASYAPDCNDPDANDPTCVDPTQEIKDKLAAAGYPYYIGHAEPTAEFFSTQGTSGYNMQWKFQLPATEPAPSQDGTNVANFELYPALWMGLELCDPNSKPYGACIATSDTNNPATAGAAFLELQFYPPGSTSGATHFSPGSCSSSQWCANLHINTLEDNNSTQTNNCVEPTTAANITTDGTPGGPQLLMNNGDTILVTIHDTTNGLQTDVKDVTTSGTGTMVASGANGFVHNANQTDCSTTAFNFHPMYATASPGQVVPWAGLKPNVAFDFEIGHWELCSDSSCSSPPDPAENGSSCGTARGVGGCVAKDSDQDGNAYLADWADGTAAHPASIILGAADDSGVGPLTTSTTSLTTYDEGYPTLAFRTTESTSTTFYPFFSQAGTGAACRFNFGNDIPSVTTNDFSKAAQYGTTISNPCLPGSKPIAKCKDTTVPTDPNLCSAATASIDNGSNDPDGDPVTLSQSPSGPYPKGTTPVTLTVTEPETTTNTCTANVIVVDKQPPSITCPSPVVECTSPAGAPVTLNPVVADNCPGLGAPVCVPPSGSTFPLGTDPFSCSVTDASGNANSCSSVVKVQDTTPPVISSVSANPNTLWPPNHKFVPVKVSVVVTDTCDPNPVCTLTGITSSEPPTGGGSGNTSPDFAITGALSAALRAERDGTGSGRTYTLAVQCTDHSGNSSQASTIVVVPHNQ